jgi:hypothetical protein
MLLYKDMNTNSQGNADQRIPISYSPWSRDYSRRYFSTSVSFPISCVEIWSLRHAGGGARANTREEGVTCECNWFFSPTVFKILRGCCTRTTECSSAPADMAHEYMSMPIMQLCKKEPQATGNKSYGLDLQNPFLLPLAIPDQLNSDSQQTLSCRSSSAAPETRKGMLFLSIFCVWANHRKKFLGVFIFASSKTIAYAKGVFECTKTNS